MTSLDSEIEREIRVKEKAVENENMPEFLVALTYQLNYYTGKFSRHKGGMIY